jgi:hypothetical protein
VTDGKDDTSEGDEGMGCFHIWGMKNRAFLVTNR